jgi:Na+/proline symporter
MNAADIIALIITIAVGAFVYIAAGTFCFHILTEVRRWNDTDGAALASIVWPMILMGYLFIVIPYIGIAAFSMLLLRLVKRVGKRHTVTFVK